MISDDVLRRSVVIEAAFCIEVYTGVFTCVVEVIYNPSDDGLNWGLADNVLEVALLLKVSSVAEFVNVE